MPTVFGLQFPSLKGAVVIAIIAILALFVLVKASEANEQVRNAPVVKDLVA